MATILAAGVAVAWSDLWAWTLGPRLAAIIGGGLLLMVWGLALMVVQWLTEDFVIPAMYIRGARVMEAWHIVWNEILKVHPGPVALFGLVHIVVAIGLGIAALIYVVLAICVTCGIACCLFWLPYVGMVMLLPLPVFVRSFTLYFVQQFGPEWQAISAEPPDAPWNTEPMLEAD